MARLIILLLYFLIVVVLPAIVGVFVLLFKAIASAPKKRAENPQKEEEHLVFLSAKKQMEAKMLEQSGGEGIGDNDNKDIKQVVSQKNSSSDTVEESLVDWEELKKKKTDKEPEAENVNLQKTFARAMTIDEYREFRQKKKYISCILRDLSSAAERNQAIDSLLEEVNGTVVPIGSIFDWRQDLIEYLVIQHGLGNLKNRYTVLQNATFVAGVLIREYMDSPKKKDFFDYIMERCGEMRFSSPLESFAYGLNADIVAKLKSKESSDAIYSYAKKKSAEYDSAHRPQPEYLYPLPKTGDAQMDRFAKLAIELTHTRLRHLRIHRKDVKEAMAELSVNPIRREYQNFSDYFSHTFQFGYLTEKRFQRLYFLLYNIAQSISQGYSDAQIRHQINNLYVVEGKKRQDKNGGFEERTKRSVSQSVTLEPIPYSEFSEKEHQIVSVAARVSREYCEHPLFKKTAKLAIDLINQYHKIETDSTEKAFFTVSISLLKKQKPQLSQAYSLIASIAKYIFDGNGEQQTYLLIKRDYFQKPTHRKQKPGSTKRTSSNRDGMVAHLRNDLISAVLACKMRRGESQCLELIKALHDSCNSIAVQSSKEYYLKLRNAMGMYRYMKGFKEVAPVVDYILYCKMNGVSDVSMMALVGSKFPLFYGRAER